MVRDLARVYLAEPRRTEWMARFAAAEQRVRRVMTDVVEHIGSTAVDDLPAKDVVDVLVGVHTPLLDEAVTALTHAGFALDGRKPSHAWLWGSGGAHGDCVVHAVLFDGPIWHARMEFRDLLRTDPIARAEYLAAKRRAVALGGGWGRYTEAKAPTVSRLLARAR